MRWLFHKSLVNCPHRCLCGDLLYRSSFDAIDKCEIYETYMHIGQIACTGKMYLISKILDSKFSIPLK